MSQRLLCRRTSSEWRHEADWYLAPVSLAVLAATPIKRKWTPLPAPSLDETVPPLGHL